MRRAIAILSITAISASFVLLAGCGGHSAQAPGVPGLGPTDYAGTQVCAICHGGQAADHADSGHPYKLNKVFGGPPVATPAAVATDPFLGARREMERAEKALRDGDWDSFGRAMQALKGLIGK